MSQGNSITIKTFDAPRDEWIKEFSDFIKWNYIKRTTIHTRSSFILYLDQSDIDRNKIDSIKKISSKIKLFLFYCPSEEPNVFLHEIGSQLSHSLLKKTIAFDRKEVLQRIVSAHGSGSEHKLISDAYVIGDTLVVYDCMAKKLEISKKHLEPIVEDDKISSDFEIHSDGSFLFWPKYDYHINIEGLRSKLDESFRKKQSLKYLHMNKKLGSAIKKLREELDLRQSDFKGLSERQLRRIEIGESIPTYKTFELLAKRHKMGIEDYISKVSEYSYSI